MHSDSSSASAVENVRTWIQSHLAPDMTCIVMDYALKSLCDYIWPFVYTTKPMIEEERFRPAPYPQRFYTNSDLVYIEYETKLVEYHVLDADLDDVYNYFKLHFPHLLQLDVAGDLFSSLRFSTSGVAFTRNVYAPLQGTIHFGN